MCIDTCETRGPCQESFLIALHLIFFELKFLTDAGAH